MPWRFKTFSHALWNPLKLRNQQALETHSRASLLLSSSNRTGLCIAHLPKPNSAIPNPRYISSCLIFQLDYSCHQLMWWSNTGEKQPNQYHDCTSVSAISPAGKTLYWLWPVLPNTNSKLHIMSIQVLHSGWDSTPLPLFYPNTLNSISDLSPIFLVTNSVIISTLRTWHRADLQISICLSNVGELPSVCISCYRVCDYSLMTLTSSTIFIIADVATEICFCLQCFMRI